MSHVPPEVQKQWMDRWQKRRAKKDFRRFPRLLMDSIKLVRATSGPRFFIIVALRAASGLMSGVMLLLGRNALAAFTGAGQGTLFRPLSLLGVVYGLSTVFGMIAGELESLLTTQVQRKTMDDVLDVATSVRLEAYESPQFFDHLKRVESNALSEPATIVRTLMQLPANLAAVAAVVGALFLLQPLLLPIVALSIIPLALMTRINSRRAFEFAKERAPGDRERDYLRTLLTGKDEAKEVRAFGVGAELRSRYERLYNDYLQQLRRFRRKQLFVSAAGSAAAFAVVAFWAIFIRSLFVSGRTSGANLGAGAVAVPMLLMRAFGFLRMVGDLYTSALFIEDYRQFLTLKRLSAEAPQSLPADRFQELRLKNINFRYPGSPADALSNVEMTIRSGEVVALVGENGSGKTTLAKLLAHLFRPVSGQILWDGVDVNTLNGADVQKQISIIFQDFVRYQLSAADNIALGRSEAASDRAAVIGAASQAGADEFLSRLEKGYETILSKAFGGIDLSIGQWQRVALARAFFRNASFIILDEPTAALDARAEHNLFERIRELRQGRTVLLISHRFSTVRSADRIYVLKHGRIVESGTHGELMDLGGLYAELYNLQASTSLNASAGRPS
jgi:ABC-type multidrug transport system fused ATPase/permease subunit